MLACHLLACLHACLLACLQFSIEEPLEPLWTLKLSIITLLSIMSRTYRQTDARTHAQTRFPLLGKFITALWTVCA